MKLSILNAGLRSFIFFSITPTYIILRTRVKANEYLPNEESANFTCRCFGVDHLITTGRNLEEPVGSGMIYKWGYVIIMSTCCWMNLVLTAAKVVYVLKFSRRPDIICNYKMILTVLKTNTICFFLFIGSSIFNSNMCNISKSHPETLIKG